MKHHVLKHLALLLLLLPSLSLAHSGGTNKDGCHNNRKTGDYHCHGAKSSSRPSTRAPSYTKKQYSSPRNSPSNTSRYNRKDWPHWTDTDDDCQNTRAEILIRDSTEPVKFKRNKGCNVSWGRWDDPYTGDTLRKASDLDIDHIVPLAHAHRTGGASWSRAKKREFANDPMNLLAVDDAANQEKSDKSPVQWKPSDHSYWCEYGKKWTAVKLKYGLKISAEEVEHLRIMKAECK